jgi:hypothetical protein
MLERHGWTPAGDWVTYMSRAEWLRAQEEPDPAALLARSIDGGTLIVEDDEPFPSCAGCKHLEDRHNDGKGCCTFPGCTCEAYDPDGDSLNDYERCRAAEDGDPVTDVTAGQLAGALEGLTVTIDERGGVTSNTPGVYAGRLAYPKTVARALLEGITRQPEPEPPAVTHAYEYGDAELRAIEAVMGTLAGLPKDGEERVLSYVCWRLGYLLYPDSDD